MVEQAIIKSTESHVLLLETIQKVTNAKMDVQLRAQLLDVLVRLFTNNKHADFVAICQCLVKLNRPEDIGKLLDRLMSHENGDLIAYQIAFDLYENASQQFNTQVLNTYASLHQPSSSAPPKGEKMEVTPVETSTEPKKEIQQETGKVESQSESKPEEKSAEESTPMARLKAILRGEETIKQHMQFLIKNNHTDMLILKEMKDCVRTATAHNATLMANGLMHLGTTCDDFLRDNLDWISKATNWNKFNAVATLGLIHKGHESAAMKLLEPYLPKTEADQFGFKEGGSLYALGDH
ncbi:unnamed protein product [Strongylus vulgaris]|uniref:26S proteasome non-ATPase regulatory subunit 1/RPN2 N-terminal domain-containing protein n=1 Tax=Strongylus vulgaris TaxID=40348 RepID=A0A3P7KHG3_STRVU|nr:unnamed protein product [Strongylus vulgaris]